MAVPSGNFVVVHTKNNYKIAFLHVGSSVHSANIIYEINKLQVIDNTAYFSKSVTSPLVFLITASMKN
jgi:hypothetical protein